MCVCVLRRSYKSIYSIIQSAKFSTSHTVGGGGDGGHDTIGGAAGNTTQLNAVVSKHSMMIACHMLLYIASTMTPR